MVVMVVVVVVRNVSICVGDIFCFIAVFSEMPVKRCGESAGTGLRSRPPYLMSVHVGRRGGGDTTADIVPNVVTAT